MSEVTFAKSFLTTIDKRPIKLPAEHVADPRKYPKESPYILPKQTHPFPRRTGLAATKKAQEQTITVSLKPMRAGETVAVTGATLDTTIHELKAQYAQKTGVSQDKIKLLINKKPANDLKTLKDLGIDQDIEISVMLIGSTGSTPRAQSPAVNKLEQQPPALPEGDKMDIDEKSPAPDSERATAEAEKQPPEGTTAADALKTNEFWSDLKGFLSQRLRDESEGERLSRIFREAWRKE